MFTCPFCNKEFEKIETLQFHFTKVHKLSKKEIEQYYVDNFKKDNEGLDPITGNPTEFISMKRGYKKYEKNNPKKLATNTVEHYMMKGLTEDEARKRVEYTNSRSSVVGKEIWKKVKSEGKTRGGWSKKHFIELGFSEVDAEKEVKKRAQLREEKLKSYRKHMRDTGEYKQYSNCCIEFYLKKGLSIEEAKKELKKRQSTNTLETYTKKYGEEQGYKKWSERNKKWSENIEQRYKNGEFTRDPNINGKLAFSSSSEHELCHELVQLLLKNNITKDKIYTQTVYNGQYHIFKHHKQYYYDFAFIDETHKKIIEYNGDFWHMNPNQYIKTDMNCVMNKTAQEIWDYDTQKSLVAQELGFDIFTVWESEYKNNKEQIINTCIKFLLNVDRI